MATGSRRLHRAGARVAQPRSGIGSLTPELRSARVTACETARVELAYQGWTGLPNRIALSGYTVDAGTGTVSDE